jgi:hypothetical protein
MRWSLPILSLMEMEEWVGYGKKNLDNRKKAAYLILSNDTIK